MRDYYTSCTVFYGANMNIDRELANRALGAVGQSALMAGDTSSKSYLLIKKWYVSTMNESLEMIPWTSARKRQALVKAAVENYSDYSLVYNLPVDCVKIISLGDNGFYIVEGRFLYTDTNDAILIYNTNGKVEAGDEIDTDDFPDYKPPVYEAMFYRSFELRLASKIALELSGEHGLYQMLLQEAMIVEEAAYRNTKTQSAGKKRGNDWWV